MVTHKEEQKLAELKLRQQKTKEASSPTNRYGRMGTRKRSNTNVNNPVRQGSTKRL